MFEFICRWSIQINSGADKEHVDLVVVNGQIKRWVCITRFSFYLVSVPHSE
jgi:hypothetical protein